MFDNTKSVKFDEKNYDKILSICSQEGETIALKEPVIAQVGAVFDISLTYVLSLKYCNLCVYVYVYGTRTDTHTRVSFAAFFVWLRYSELSWNSPLPFFAPVGPCK